MKFSCLFFFANKLIPFGVVPSYFQGLGRPFFCRPPLFVCYKGGGKEQVAEVFFLFRSGMERPGGGYLSFSLGRLGPNETCAHR